MQAYVQIASQPKSSKTDYNEQGLELCCGLVKTLLACARRRDDLLSRRTQQQKCISRTIMQPNMTPSLLFRHQSRYIVRWWRRDFINAMSYRSMVEQLNAFEIALSVTPIERSAVKLTAAWLASQYAPEGRSVQTTQAQRRAGRLMNSPTTDDFYSSESDTMT